MRSPDVVGFEVLLALGPDVLNLLDAAGEFGVLECTDDIFAVVVEAEPGAREDLLVVGRASWAGSFGTYQGKLIRSPVAEEFGMKAVRTRFLG